MHTNSEKICDKITSHRCPSNPLGQFLKKKEKKKEEEEEKEEEEDGEFRPNFKLDIDGTVGLL